MYDTDTTARINRAAIRCKTAGGPYPLFRGDEVDELFRESPFAIPSLQADGIYPGWHRAAETIQVRDQLEVERACVRLRDWADRNTNRLVGIGIIEATPGSFTIAAYTRDKLIVSKREALTNEQFLDGEDPRQPICT